MTLEQPGTLWFRVIMMAMELPTGQSGVNPQVIGTLSKVMARFFWSQIGVFPVISRFKEIMTATVKQTLLFTDLRNAVWYIRNSSGGQRADHFGVATDIPVTGDFDGDFRSDLTVYRNGIWYTMQSSNNATEITSWGNSTDTPVSGDFDGDGRTDIGIYRDGVWWILQSLTGTPMVVPFGLSIDITTVGDFDGDGTSDLAVYRPTEGNWYVLRSSDLTLTGVK